MSRLPILLLLICVLPFSANSRADETLEELQKQRLAVLDARVEAAESFLNANPNSTAQSLHLLRDANLEYFAAQLEATTDYAEQTKILQKLVDNAHHFAAKLRERNESGLAVLQAESDHLAARIRLKKHEQQKPVAAAQLNQRRLLLIETLEELRSMAEKDVAASAGTAAAARSWMALFDVETRLMAAHLKATDAGDIKKRWLADFVQNCRRFEKNIRASAENDMEISSILFDISTRRFEVELQMAESDDVKRRLLTDFVAHSRRQESTTKGHDTMVMVDTRARRIAAELRLAELETATGFRR